MSQIRLFDKWFKDKSGKVVLFQLPNAALAIFLVLDVLSGVGLARHNRLATLIFGAGSILALAWWAVQEITKGVNYFRRILGVIGLAICFSMALGLLIIIRSY